MPRRKKPVRIGLVGCGHIAEAHFHAICQINHAGLAEVQLVHACDSQPERAELFRRNFGFEHNTPDYRRVIEDASLDAVYVCTPTGHHLPMVLLAAELGRPLFCEKPLGRNLAEVEAMCQAVRKAGLHAQLGLVLRFSQVYTVMKSLLDEGGRPMAAVFRDDQYFPVGGSYGSDWRSHRELVGSGALLEHSIHDIDLLRWFFGEVTRVHARMEYFSGREGIEDRAVLMLDFDSGAAATLVSLWHQVLGRESNRNLEVFLERRYLASSFDFAGSIRVQEHTGRPTTMAAREVDSRYRKLVGRGVPPQELRQNPYLMENLAFLRSLPERTPPFPDFNTGLAAHRVVEAAYQSAWECQPVEPARVARG